MSWCIQHSEDSFLEVDTKKTEEIDKLDLMFAGNIGKVQNVEDIILAYNELRYPDLRIHIFGDGSSYEDCRRLVEEKGILENVIFYGRVSRDELAGYYKKMDACLLTLSGRTAIGNTIPSKLSGYLSARKTIVAAIAGDSRYVIDAARCGLYTDPDDYKKLAETISELYHNRERYSECGIRGREYFEKYCTLDRFMEHVDGVFSKLISTEKQDLAE